MTTTEEFIELYKNNIKREGSNELLDFLIKSDFFTAPASTKFHSAFEGGLCDHSIKAYKRFLKNIKNEYGEDYNNKISDESIAICGLLHDVCKIGYYKVEYRNAKEDGEWIKKPYYTVSDSLPYGHGEKSVYILSGFMRLTREEAMIINWHMGGFDKRVLGGDYSLSEVFNTFPNALIFHVSDMQSSYLDEER